MSCTCMVPEEKGGLLNLPTPTVTRTANTLHYECPLGKNASLRDSPTSDYIPEIFFFFVIRVSCFVTKTRLKIGITSQQYEYLSL